MTKILIIEDNTDVRENLAEILNLSGYETIEAENGKIGVEKAANDEPDLVICDVMMPYLDGFGVLKILKQNPKTQYIPFLFLTAKSEKLDFRKGMGLGADDYITKPFDDTELLEAIETRIKRSSEQLRQLGSFSNQSAFIDLSQAEKQILELLKDDEERVYMPKEMLFKSTQKLSTVYYLKSGCVRLFNQNEFGKELSYQIIRKDSFIDLASIFNRENYFHSAECLEESSVILINTNEFKKKMLSNRLISQYLFQQLSHQIDQYEAQLIEAAYSSVRRKVALCLIKAKNNSNVVDFSREILASMAGVAKETLIRTLSDFKSEGLIQIINHVIYIQDEVALSEMPQ